MEAFRRREIEPQRGLILWTRSNLTRAPIVRIRPDYGIRRARPGPKSNVRLATKSDKYPVSDCKETSLSLQGDLGGLSGPSGIGDAIGAIADV